MYVWVGTPRELAGTSQGRYATLTMQWVAAFAKSCNVS